MYRDLTDYYLRWYHRRPVGITTERQEEFRRLHRVLYRCIEELVYHYPQYTAGWPLGERELEILDIQKDYPFRAGTYRPDYILSSDGRILLCEITSRFFAHGIFMSWFAEKAADLFMARFPGKTHRSAYPALLEKMKEIVGDRRRMYVFKSADRTSEIRLYKRFYERLGCNVTVLEAPEVEAARREWERGAFLVSGLNQQDLMSFSDDTLRAMAEAGMYSDFRNVFLIHDKRFMNLWFDDRFTAACLSPDDTAFLRAHAIPTFLCSNPSSAPVLEEAFDHKDAYILKPCRLGKSEGIHAGPLMKESDWKHLWDSPLDDYILQPFIPQKTFPAEWEGTLYQDYLCGMMLCVDDGYYDSGMFRASSLPVTNLGDNRKACALHTDDPDLRAECDLL